MNQLDSSSSVHNAPVPVRVLSIALFVFAFAAALGSLFLWGQGFIFDAPEGVDLAFPIADLLVNLPVSLTAAVGLWRMRRYGYVAAQIAAGIYLYASVEIFVDLWQNGAASTGEFIAIVIPQALAVITACVLVIYLWKEQDRFFSSEH
jgi:hypothetical protein